jgi:DNA-binding IclR family transcriptional regulator
MSHIPAAPPATTLAPLRVMQLISALASRQDGVSLAQLSTELGLPKSSALSLLRTLSSGGYVASGEDGWRLGQESFALATLVARSRPFPAQLRPLLAALHKQCGETVLIAVPSDDWSEIVYVDLIESDQSLRFKVEVGSRDPVYCTALGLAMLAFVPAAQQRQYVGSVQLKRRTEGTLTSRAQLLRFLADVKERAVSVSSGINVNVTAIAAPVFGSDGEVLASVALAGLTAHVERRRARLSELVRRTGAAMSECLGCRTYPPREDLAASGEAP